MSLGVDNAWSLTEFKRNLGVRITGGPSAAAAVESAGKASTSTASASASADTDPDSLTFDVAGIDASLANALRRILLSELPSVAIEHVFVLDNTSVVACEILSHRLGLVPLAVDPAALAGRSSHGGEPATEANTVVFKLVAECKRVGGGSRSGGGGGGEEEEEEAGVVTGERVLSGALEWLPKGSELPEETGATFSTSQEGRFKVGGGGAGAATTTEAENDDENAREQQQPRPLRLGAPRPVHDDILLARLRPGQRIELEAHATVGTGGEHAKWSPVATAWYRLQPELFVSGSAQPSSTSSSTSNLITGEDADALAEELPGLVGVRGSGASREAVLAAPARGNERLLEKARRLSGEPRFAGKLALKRAKDHFIFCVESVGALPPGELVVRALEVLEAKCDRLMERI